MRKNKGKNNTDTSLVFVYGTLMQGETNHYYMRDAELIGEGEIAGFDMFTGSFPMIVPGLGRVVGEVYKVDTFDYLDRLEGYREGREGNMYDRKVTTCTLENGSEVAVHYYLWNGGTVRLIPIPSGVKWSGQLSRELRRQQAIY